MLSLAPLIRTAATFLTIPLFGSIVRDTAVQHARSTVALSMNSPSVTQEGNHGSSGYKGAPMKLSVSALWPLPASSSLRHAARLSTAYLGLSPA